MAEVDDDGIVTARAPGSAEIRATWQGVESSGARVEVIDTDVVGLTLQTPTTRVPLAASPRIGATAVFANGTISDVTGQVLWRSSAPRVARVDGNGRLVPVAPGKTEIVGTLAGSSSVPLQIEVVAGEVVALQLGPPVVGVVPVGSARVEVLGLLDDGSSLPLDGQVEWEISGHGVSEDRAGALVVGHGAQARVRARFQGLRSNQIEVIATSE